jgi:hypothetical protein
MNLFFTSPRCLIMPHSHHIQAESSTVRATPRRFCRFILSPLLVFHISIARRSPKSHAITVLRAHHGLTIPYSTTSPLLGTPSKTFHTFPRITPSLSNPVFSNTRSLPHPFQAYTPASRRSIPRALHFVVTTSTVSPSTWSSDLNTSTLPASTGALSVGRLWSAIPSLQTPSQSKSSTHVPKTPLQASSLVRQPGRVRRSCY